MEKENTFEKLNSINLKDKTKEKIGLKYLSWSDAWNELKKVYPDAERIIYRREVEVKSTKTIQDGNTTEVVETSYVNEVPYFTDGKTCTVRVGVKINGVEYIEELPVMDNKNKSIRLELVSSTDVNRALQRCFVKACALHGLGLYIYSGEDLPEADRIVIDFNALKATEVKEEITKEQFEEMQKYLIAKLPPLQQMDESISVPVVNYVVELFPGKRISCLEYPIDSENLQKLHSFITKVYAAIDKK